MKKDAKKRREKKTRKKDTKKKTRKKGVSRFGTFGTTWHNLAQPTKVVLKRDTFWHNLAHFKYLGCAKTGYVLAQPSTTFVGGARLCKNVTRFGATLHILNS